MALKDSRAFRAIAYTMFSLVLASFTLAIFLRVVAGHGADTYVGGRGMPIPNIAAMVTIVTIVTIALIIFVWLCQLAWRKWRHQTSAVGRVSTRRLRLALAST